MTQGAASTWRDLYAIVRPCGRRRLALVLAMMMAQALLQTLAVFSLVPFLSAAADIDAFRQSRLGSLFVSAIGGGSDHRILSWAGSISLAILVASNLMALTADYGRSRYAYLVGHLLRIRLLADLLDRRYEYFLGINSSVLLKNLVDDTGHVADHMVSPALDIVARVVLVLLLAAGVMLVEPLIVAGGLVVVVLYYLLVMRPIRRRAQRTSDRVKHDIRALYFEITQTLGAIKPILAADRKNWFVARAERISRLHAEEVPRMPMYAAIPRSGLEVVVFGGMIAWVLGALVTGGNLVAMMPRIGLIALVAYRVMPSVQLIFMQIAHMTAAGQSLEEVTGLMREQQAHSALGAREAGNAAPEPMHWKREIRFDAVNFTYAGAAEPALADISFTIRKGERVAFVGPTGSGKSTLIDLFLGLLRPSSGHIMIDGQPLSADTMPAWRRAVGYVPQELFLLDGTIAENIAFGGEGSRDRVLGVSEVAQVRKFVEEGQPEGFDTQVGERGVRISGGQRQRIALARALFGHPNVLVLDEATSALDPATEKRVVAALNQESEKLTVVTVTHRLGTVKDYHCIHYVEHGRIVASGGFEELARSHPAFRELAG